MVDPSSNEFQRTLAQDLQQPQRPPPSQQPQPQSLVEASLRNKKKRSGAAAGAEDGQNDGTGGQTMVFPVKLHRMLTEIEEKANADKDSTASGSGIIPGREDACNVISWQIHGRCFLVHDKEAFVQWLLPSYFRQSKWASFQRQLNIYGFQRLTAGRDRGAYYHDLFLRGHPQLATRIHRMKLKGIGQGRHRTNTELEPNFYCMQAVGPGDQVDATLIGMQPNASAAAVAYALGKSPASAPAVSVTQAHTSTANAIQLFGGGKAGPVTKTSALPLVTHGMDPSLNTVFFFTNANGLASLPRLGGGTMAGGGAAVVMQHSSAAGRSTQQEGLQPSKHHCSFLANLFSGTANNSNHMASTGTDDAQVNHRRRASAETQVCQVGTDSTNELNQWSPSNLFGCNTSNIALLQNPDTKLLTTATLMQYMGDTNASDGTGFLSHGQASSDATSNTLANVTSQPTTQSPWTSLASGGLSSDNISITNSAGPNHGNALVAKASSSDLLNTFWLDGPSVRRMPAAAVSSIFTPHASNPASATNLSGSPFDSNPDLLLFPGLKQSQKSSNNDHLMECSPLDPSGTMATAQALNWMTAGHHSTIQESSITVPATAPGPTPTSASQGLGFADMEAVTGGSADVTPGTSGRQSGYLFGDNLPACGGTAASQPTFLDSVYEPIPIKEGVNAANEGVVIAAHGNGQQHKLSPRAIGASADHTQGVGGRGGHCS